MTSKTFEIRSYNIAVGYEFNLRFVSSGSEEDVARYRGMLICSGDDGYRFIIYFAAPGSVMNPPEYLPELKYGSITVPVDEMPHYVDLVRNEKPVYAILSSEKPHFNLLATSPEPVGEEESSR